MKMQTLSQIGPTSLVSTILFMGLIGSPPAEAASFSARSQAIVYGVAADSKGDTSNQPLGFFANIDHISGGATARSYAGRGLLRVRYEATALQPGTQAEGYASASFTFDDLVFSGPPQSGPLSASLNLSIDGIFNSFGAPGNPPSNWVSIGLGYRWTDGVQSSTGLGRVSYVGGAVYRDGLLANFDQTIDNLITTPTFQFDPTKPQSVSLSLGAQGIAIARNDAMAYSSANFYNTVSFARTGPVFNLPTGWTVNSQDGLIVNNRFVGLQSPVPPPTSVPEPGAIAGLLLLGVGVLTLRKPGRVTTKGTP